MPSFRIHTTDPASRARRAALTTPHGTVQTPAFMPVGTQASVKSVTPAQLDDIGAQIILSNTYHLNLRPTSELIARRGGLHAFMGWQKPILTDSGGFQVFSLSQLRKITEEGIAFRSHLDGAQVFLGPKECVRIQAQLGSDIAMVLDECSPYPCPHEDALKAVERTVRWAAQCKEAAKAEGIFDSGRHLFAIVQGSLYPDLRVACAQALAELDLPGYAIGGVSVGEPEPEMLAQVDAAASHLPLEKPRYVMGVGTPPQLLRMVALGADMFDCVMPTRLARHGTAFTLDGPINLKNERFKEDDAPIEPALLNYASGFSRAYLRHLVTAGEMLACTLLSIHNLHFFLDLMAQARLHLEAGDYTPWAQSWCARYEANAREK